MSYYDTSYPPSLYALPSSHDLKLVGTPRPGTLIVDFTWDSDGKSASLQFGDGQSVSNTTESATHTYAAHQIYNPTVRSGNASDSAQLDLTITVVEDTPEAESFKAVKVDELPDTEEIPVTDE
jgi:PKD repeat protein